MEMKGRHSIGLKDDGTMDGLGWWVRVAGGGEGEPVRQWGSSWPVCYR